MTIYRKVRAVERVFGRLEKEVAAFKDATGMTCISGCGLCCKKPDITATALEFLPFAYQRYRAGDAYLWLQTLQEEKDNKHCKIFKPLTTEDEKGFCSQYKYRGLICRLFGFSAMLNKQAQPQLVTCKTIKAELPVVYRHAVEHVAANHPIPIMRNFYFQLRAIDPDLGSQLLPVNKAIVEALKVVLSYYAYRVPRGA